MVDIILVLEIRAIDLGKQLQRLSRIREQVARIFEAVQGLDDHAKPCLGSTISNPGQILTHKIHLCLATLSRDAVPNQCIELGTAYCSRKVQGVRHMGAEPLLPTGVVEKTTLSARHIARVKIHERHSKSCRLHLLCDGSQVFL